MISYMYIIIQQSSLGIGDLVKEFTQVAEILAQVIIDDLYKPLEQKIIPPAKLGGVAGGSYPSFQGLFSSLLLLTVFLCCLLF